jgi:uncharacterized damage-inducible protein DinB
METTSLDQLRYPVGKFNFNADANEKEISQWIAEIENLPLHLRNAVKGLNDAQLNTPYRDGGWTVRQVVHHVADSHLNAYTRFKLALTEDKPTIKPYLEKLWAEMDDSTELPVEISLAIVESLHLRMVYILKKIKESELGRTVYHPESKREMSIKFLLALYSWHGKHHTAHIAELRKRMKW